MGWSAPVPEPVIQSGAASRVPACGWRAAKDLLPGLCRRRASRRHLLSAQSFAHRRSRRGSAVLTRCRRYLWHYLFAACRPEFADGRRRYVNETSIPSPRSIQRIPGPASWMSSGIVRRMRANSRPSVCRCTEWVRLAEPVGVKWASSRSPSRWSRLPTPPGGASNGTAPHPHSARLACRRRTCPWDPRCTPRTHLSRAGTAAAYP